MQFAYKSDNSFPIKGWLNKDEYFQEEELVKQTENLAKLPFLYKWVVLCADAHPGYGMPIGGVIATKNVIIPHAVGSDIGCGMGFIHTNIPAEIMHTINTNSGDLKHQIMSVLMKNIPVGFAKHKEPQHSTILDEVLCSHEYRNAPDIITNNILENAYHQVGTLGGGNHFVELQEDEEGNLAIMLHSGSRNLGNIIFKYYNKIAIELNKKWYSNVPENYQLAFLPLDTQEGKEYEAWMNIALRYAQENRKRMMERTKNAVINCVKKYAGIKNIEIDREVNIHHNYARIENHYNENVIVHRKGAICVREGDLGIIPGAMGSDSYIVKGKGNSESFNSCSHGAGRAMSRTMAMNKYSIQDVIEDLRSKNVFLAKQNKTDVASECLWSYKNINKVIENQKDLIEPVMKLKTIAVLKG